MRPWRLECWEYNPDTIEEEWRPWSTYGTEENAAARRDKLIVKGHNARVIHIETGVVLGSTSCTLCGDSHPEGSCLI